MPTESPAIQEKHIRLAQAHPKVGVIGAPRLAPPAKADRRRGVGVIRHNEHGSAYVEWRPAPPGYVRQKFEIVEDTGITATGIDPYNSSTLPR